MERELAEAGVVGVVEEKKSLRMPFRFDLVYPQDRAGRCSHSFPCCCSTHSPEVHSLGASYTISSEELFGVLGGGGGLDGTEGYRVAGTQVGSEAELPARALGPWGLVRC